MNTSRNQHPSLFLARPFVTIRMYFSFGRPECFLNFDKDPLDDPPRAQWSKGGLHVSPIWHVRSMKMFLFERKGNAPSLLFGSALDIVHLHFFYCFHTEKSSLISATLRQTQTTLKWLLNYLELLRKSFILINDSKIQISLQLGDSVLQPHPLRLVMYIFSPDWIICADKLETLEIPACSHPKTIIALFIQFFLLVICWMAEVLWKMIWVWLLQQKTLCCSAWMNDQTQRFETVADDFLCWGRHFNVLVGS